MFNEIGINDKIFLQDYKKLHINLLCNEYLLFKIYDIKKLEGILNKYADSIHNIIIEMFDVIMFLKKEQKKYFSSIFTRYVEGIDYNIRKFLRKANHKIYFDDITNLTLLENLVSQKQISCIDEIDYFNKKTKKLKEQQLYRLQKGILVGQK